MQKLFTQLYFLSKETKSDIKRYTSDVLLDNCNVFIRTPVFRSNYLSSLFVLKKNKKFKFIYLYTTLTTILQLK